MFNVVIFKKCVIFAIDSFSILKGVSKEICNSQYKFYKLWNFVAKPVVFQ